MLSLRPTNARVCELCSRADGAIVDRAAVGAAVAARGVHPVLAGRAALVACVALILVACSGAPTKPDRETVAPEGATSSAAASGASAGSQKNGAATPGASGAPGSAAPVVTGSAVAAGGTSGSAAPPVE